MYTRILHIRSVLLLIGIIVLMLPSAAIGSLLVNLDADNLPIGNITSWTNAGTLGGIFGNDTTTVTVVNMGGKRCINFTGTNRMKSSFNAPAGITGNAAHSVAYWVYNPAIASNETVVSWSKAGTNGKDAQYEYGSSTTTGAANHAGTTYSMGWSGGAPTAGSWHHICITFSGSQCKVYKDGVLNGTKSMTLNINTAMPIIIAAGKTSAGAYTNYFSGYVHSVQVYDTALSQAQITALVGRDAEVYLSNEIYYADSNGKINVRKSQHFRIVWGKTDPSGLMNEDYVQGNLWQLENCWQRYHIYQGFHEPGVSVDPLYQDGNKYKVNFYVNNTGLDRFVGDLGAFMGGDEHGFGYFSEPPTYMRWDPPSGATYHEYAHVCEMHAEGFNNGPSGVWWECFADWMELQFEAESIHYPDGAYTINQTSWLYQGHGRHYYDNWQIFEYLKEQPSYGYYWINVLWTQANGAYIFDAMATLDPSSNPDKVDQVKDNFNSMAAHNVNWDYGWGQIFREDDINPDKWRTGRCELIAKPGSTTAWRVPWDMAPQQMGYNIIPLKMPGKTGSAWTVTANMTGFNDPARGSDWRCTLVAISDAGSCRYVQWHTGSNSITLASNENRCYLVVSGTPTFMAVSDSDDPRGLLREGLPYEVTFTNAVPNEYAPSPNDPAKCPTVQDVAGKRCATFDANDKLTSTVNAPAGVVGNGDWSVAAWVYNPSISDAESYLSWSHRDGAAGSNSEMIYGSNPDYGATGHWGAGDMGFDGGVPSAGAWHHIAVTFDGATEKVYVDGTPNATEAKTLALYSGYPFNLGCGVSSGRVGTDFFSGSMYSARVFDRALSPTEVTTLATNLDYAKTDEVVFVEARALSLGTLTSWTNQGSAGGNFVPSIGAPHSNGGGWVESSATVAASAYVGPNAMVLGAAQVRDYARIDDYAVVEGSAQVYGNAIVSGHGWVKGSAQVYGNAKVRDYACVEDDALVYDNARLCEHATAWGGAPYNTKVCENGVMRGAASSWDESGGTNYIKGYSIWDGDATCGVNTTKGVLIGWLRDQTYADSLPDLNGLYCQYDFETTHAVWIWDKYGMVYGLPVGGPTITTDSDFNRHNVLNLNGSSQYVELRRDIPDVKDITIMGWMYWTGTATNQRFFSMGDGSGKYMYVTPKDSSTNKLRFVICNGTTTQYLDGAAAIPASTWTHVAVVLNGTSGKLFVGGTPVGTGTISIDPDQLLPADVNSTPTCNYLGKGPAGNYFQGKVDDFRVYTKPLSDAEVNAIATATIRIVPQMSSLIFGCDTDSFPASGPTGAWTAFYPLGVVLSAMASPTVDTLNGKKWDLNLYADGDGYDQGYYSSPIPCSGASIVVAVKPTRNTTSCPWISIVDVFYNCLVLGIHNNTGEICVYRNGTLNDTGAIIPNGQMTVLSLVVQSNGNYKVYANGTQVVNDTTTSTMTQLAPGTEAYMHNINVGRNYPDTWTTFNGDIGDVFLYKIALSDADRQTLESQTRTKFGF